MSRTPCISLLLMASFLSLTAASAMGAAKRPASVPYEFPPLWLPDLRGVIGAGAGLRLPHPAAAAETDPYRPFVAAPPLAPQSGIPLGPPGSTAAEFVVGSEGFDQNRRVDHQGKEEEEEEDEFQLLPQKNEDKVRPFVPCSEETRLSLHERPGFSGGVLRLTRSAPRLGVHGFPTSSAEVDGDRAAGCCWELFDRAGFAGRMIRLCPGRYDRSVLRSAISAAIKSARAVQNPKARLRRDGEEEEEEGGHSGLPLTPEEALVSALLHKARRI